MQKYLKHICRFLILMSIFLILYFILEPKSVEIQGDFNITYSVEEVTKKELMKFQVNITNNTNQDAKNSTVLLCIRPSSNENRHGLSLLPLDKNTLSIRPNTINIKKGGKFICYFYLEKRFWNQLEDYEKKELYIILNGEYSKNNEYLEAWYHIPN